MRRLTCWIQPFFLVPLLASCASDDGDGSGDTGDGSQTGDGDFTTEGTGDGATGGDGTGGTGDSGGVDCDTPPDLAEAQDAWARGDVEDAHSAVLALLECEESDDALALAAATSFAKGLYEDALALHDRIDPSWPDYDSLDDAVVQAHCHLHRCEDALDFAEARGLDDFLITQLRQRAEKPLEVSLSTVTTVAFDTGDSLTQYIPGFPSEVNGMSTLMRLDTGGSWAISSPAVADSFGIETECGGMGMQGNTPSNLCFGLADTVVLGDATLTNVPFITMDTLTLPEPIIGTNMFQQFLSTLDYPRDRLVMSPRGDDALAQEHVDMLGGELATMPYYMWSDHFMFARGGLGDRTDLNFFIDSGLVAVDPNTGVQAAIMATADALAEFGAVADPNGAGEYFALDGNVVLGSLSQSGHTAWNQKTPLSTLGGVRIDALLSHAWLNRYAWTIDFDARDYVFRE